MALLLDYDDAGVLQSDQIVRCDKVTTIGGTGYYKGRLPYLPAGNLRDGTNTNVGVYLSTAHTTQLGVLESGVPPDVNNVVVDFDNAHILSTTQRNLYVDYYGITSVNQEPPLILTIDIPESLLNGVAVDPIRGGKVPQFCKFGFGQVSIYGSLPPSVGTLTFKNQSSGGESVTLPLGTSENNAVTEFSEPLTLTEAQEWFLTTPDGLGATGLTVRLFGF